MWQNNPTNGSFSNYIFCVWESLLSQNSHSYSWFVIQMHYWDHKLHHCAFQEDQKRQKYMEYWYTKCITNFIYTKCTMHLLGICYSCDINRVNISLLFFFFFFLANPRFLSFWLCAVFIYNHWCLWITSVTASIDRCSTLFNRFTHSLWHSGLQTMWFFFFVVVFVFVLFFQA